VLTGEAHAPFVLRWNLWFSDGQRYAAIDANRCTGQDRTPDTLPGKDASGAGVESRSVRPGIDRIVLSGVAPKVAEPFYDPLRIVVPPPQLSRAQVGYGRQRLLESGLRLAVELVSRTRSLKRQKLDREARFYAKKIPMNLFLYALSALQRP
jgi:hypothetical protein